MFQAVFNLKSSLDRFIGTNFSINASMKPHLKSSLDRFIDYTEEMMYYSGYLFKIQFG